MTYICYICVYVGVWRDIRGIQNIWIVTDQLDTSNLEL